MAEKNNPDPTTAEESDISKAQAQQQPPEQAKQQPEASEQTGEVELGQQTETLTEQQTDVEVGPLDQGETAETETSFVGSEGQRDTSGELIQDTDEDEGDEDLKSDGE